jgi:hypothetical protein
MSGVVCCRDVGFKASAVGTVSGKWTWGVIEFDSHDAGQAQIHHLSGIPPHAQILGAAGFQIVDLTLSTPGVAITITREDVTPPPAKRARVEQSAHVLADAPSASAVEQSAPVLADAPSASAVEQSAPVLADATSASAVEQSAPVFADATSAVAPVAAVRTEPTAEASPLVPWT